MLKDKNLKILIIAIILLFCVVCCVIIGIGFSLDFQKVDMVYVNEVIQCIKQGSAPQKIVYDYILVDKGGAVLSGTISVGDMGYQTRLSKAYAAGDIVVDFDADSKLIFFTNSEQKFYKMRNNILYIVAGGCALLAAAMCAAAILVHRRMVKPFNRLQGFAADVAKGNLDSPLMMDKYLTFGAFGEAFDIMRNNLKEARIAEQTANIERSRLLQEIGHEIKTPLSTIKAVAECGYAVSGDKNYTTILNKATAIDNLINDFYQKALEDEGQLNIYITRHSSAQLKEIVEDCDYNQRVVFGEVPSCDVLYDKNRLVQIVENIIANSYKYADTEIKVDFHLSDRFLQVTFADFGEGVEDEQLSHIMDRFYRGDKTSEKLGQGLGLNISRKLIMRMGGEMECYNSDGFVVSIKLQLYGG